MASWCKPSQVMLPIIKEVTSEANMPLIIHDINDEPEIGIKYDVVGTPTILILGDDGLPERTLVGMKNKGSLKGFLGIL